MAEHRYQAMHDELTRCLRPGDVVLENWDLPWWSIVYRTGAATVRYLQRRWLGDDVLWTHNHSMLYLDPERALDFVLFSVRWRPIARYYGSVSVWRHTPGPASSAEQPEPCPECGPFSDDRVQAMSSAASSFIGRLYNIPMFLMMALRGRLLTRWLLERMLRLMPHTVVCSVGVRLALRGGVDRRSEDDDGLFSGVPVVCTTPAHYSLGPARGASFVEVMRFEKGRRVGIRRSEPEGERETTCEG